MKVTKNEKLADMPLYPPLEKLLTDLYLKVPALVFEAQDHLTWARDLGQEAGAQINAVLVFNGVERVGRIEVNYRQHRGSSDRVHVYEINSHRIQKRIGSRSTKETSKYPEALKVSSKVYSQTKTQHERGMELWEKFAREINGIKYASQRNAERIVEDYALVMAEYFVKASKGEAVPIPVGVHKMLAKPDMEKLISTHKIVQYMHDVFEQGDGVVVATERDGSMTAVTRVNKDFSTRKLLSSYDLPEVLQPKIGMLKMLKEKQAAESIGVRFMIDDSDWFFLCNGEIITDS
jgi:hypothetical protein